MNIYAADMQKVTGMEEIYVRATDRADAVERLEKDGWQVITLHLADISVLRCAAVLAAI